MRRTELKRYIDACVRRSIQKYTDDGWDNQHKGNTNFARIFSVFKRFTTPDVRSILRNSKDFDAYDGLRSIVKAEELIKKGDTSYSGDYLERASALINKYLKNNSDSIEQSDSKTLKKTARMLEALASNIWNTRK